MSYSAPPGGPGPAAPYGAPGQQPSGPYGAPPQQPGWYPPVPPPPNDPGGGQGLKTAVIGLSALALVAVLGVGGFAVYKAVGGGSMPGAEGTGDDTEQVLSQEDIATLLNGRTQALKSGDEDEYLAPFDGEAKEEQRQIFRNLRKVPFAESKYMVLQQTGDGSDEYGSDVKLALDVAFVHQIEGVDVRPVSEWYRWEVERDSKEAEPRITGVGGSPSAYGLGATAVYYPAPWDLYDDMYVKRQGHTVTIAAKKNAAAASRYAPIIEQSAKTDLDLWKSKAPSVPNTPKGFLVVVEPDRKTYTKLYNNGGLDVGWDAGQSVPMPTFNEGYGGKEDRLEFGGARIKMDASSERFTSSAWRRGVADISRHEIAHALVQPQDSGSYSFDDEKSLRSWVVEGFAEYVTNRFDRELGDQGVRNALAGQEFDGELPSSDFDSDANPVSMNYALSYLAIRFIAEEGGEEAVFKFVVDHYKKPTELDQQLQSAVGMGESEFQAAWAQYVRSNSR